MYVYILLLLNPSVPGYFMNVMQPWVIRRLPVMFHGCCAALIIPADSRFRFPRSDWNMVLFFFISESLSARNGRHHMCEEHFIYEVFLTHGFPGLSSFELEVGMVGFPWNFEYDRHFANDRVKNPWPATKTVCFVADCFVQSCGLWIPEGRSIWYLSLLVMLGIL